MEVSERLVQVFLGDLNENKKPLSSKKDEEYSSYVLLYDLNKKCCVELLLCKILESLDESEVGMCDITEQCVVFFNHKT